MAITGFWRGPAGSGGGTSYDDTAITARVAAVEADVDTLQTDVAGLPDPYDDTALTGRVTAVEGEVDALQVADTTISGRVTSLENEPAPSWGDVTEKPATFAPAAHTHPVSEVTGLQAALDDKLDADRLVSLTQAEYDALGTPDPDTFYFISG